MRLNIKRRVKKQMLPFTNRDGSLPKPVKRYGQLKSSISAVLRLATSPPKIGKKPHAALMLLMRKAL